MPGALAITLEHVGPSGAPSPAGALPPPATEQSLATSPPIVGALKAVGEVLREAVLTTFREQRDPWGNPWRPLAPATIMARARRLGVSIHRVTGERRGKKRDLVRASSMLILVDRATLRNGITTAIEALGVSVGVGGAAQKYGRAQQFGLPGGRRWGRATVGPLPARAFFPVRADGTVDLPATIRREISETLHDALGSMLREIAFG